MGGVGDVSAGAFGDRGVELNISAGKEKMSLGNLCIKPELIIALLETSQSIKDQCPSRYVERDLVIEVMMQEVVSLDWRSGKLTG